VSPIHLRDGVGRNASKLGKRLSAGVAESLAEFTNTIGLKNEETLQQMIICLGVMAGAGWEEAFGAANGVLAEKANLFPEHPRGQAITHSAICMLVVGVMVPAWRWYIIPRASGTYDQ